MTYFDSYSQQVFRICDVVENEGNTNIADYATQKVELDETVCVGSGYVFELAKDTTVMFSDLYFKQPTRFKETSKGIFGACLVLEGQLDIVVPHSDTVFTASKDKALFFLCHNSDCEFRYPKGAVKLVNFCVPKETMYSLVDESLLQENSMGCYFSVSVTSDITKTVDEIYRSELTKSAKNLYLQGKVMELLAKLYHNFNAVKHVYSGVTPRDVDCIYDAARIIEEEMANPPSLFELSRKVGINDNKLKKNFKLVFNNTVYGYLNNKRMIKASELLLNGDLTVQEVALNVGYKHVGHFSKKFKQYYLCSPKHYRRKSVIAE